MNTYGDGNYGDGTYGGLAPDRGHYQDHELAGLDHSDVNGVALVVGDVLMWNGSVWAPAAISSGGSFNAVDITISDAGANFTATNVEAALAEEADARQAHEANSAIHGPYAAASVSLADTANLFAAANVEAAFAEEATARLAHANNTTTAHNATAIPITDAGANFSATNVETALAEEADARQAHEANAAIHGGGGGSSGVLFPSGGPLTGATPPGTGQSFYDENTDTIWVYDNGWVGVGAGGATPVLSPPVHITSAFNNADLTSISTSSVALPARSLILVAAFARTDIGVVTPTATLAGGLVWTEVKNQAFDGQNSRLYVWAAMTGDSGVTATLTVTWGATVRGSAILAEGVLDGGPIVRSVAGTPGVAAASATLAIGVLTQATNCVVGFAAIGRADRNIAPQVGWTELGEQTINTASGRTGDVESQYFMGSETDISASISSGTTPWGLIGVVVAPRVVHARTHKVLSVDHSDVDATDTPTVADALTWNGTKWIAARQAAGYYESSGAPVITDSDFPAVPPDGSFAVTHNTNTGEDLVWFKSANGWHSLAGGTSTPPVVPGGPFGIATTTNPLTGENDNWGLSCHRVAWWNAAKSRWDGVLPVALAGGAADDGDWHIVGGLTSNIPTLKNLVDGRTNARPDIIWDDTAGKLYVAMHGALSAGVGGTMYVYSYNQTSDTYTLLRTTQMGINLSGGDAGGTIMRSPNGYLWVAGNDTTGAFRINRSIDDGVTWGTPFSLKTTQAIGKSGLSWFINGGVTYVFAGTSENGIAVVAPNSAKYYSFRIQQDAAYNVLGNWTEETANMPPLVAGEYEADDEYSITKDAAHNIYVTMETEILDDVNNPPQWVLYKRTPAGVWTQYHLHQDVVGETARKRPVVCVDDSNSKIYVFAQVADEQRIIMKTAPLNALGNLENGSAGEIIVFSETGKLFRNTHVPSNVTSQSDLLVVSDQRTDLKGYWNLIAIP